METIGKTAGQALTALQARSTPGKPPNTEDWAKWAGFDLCGTPEELAQLRGMVDAVARFVREVKANDAPRWLSLLGPSGAGKSYLAKRVWRWYRYGGAFKAIMARGSDGRDEVQYPGEWCWWPDLAAELSANRGYAQVDELKRARLVVIDEIGADRDPNGHCKDHLARLLCSRVGKWTLITSNLSLEGIADGAKGVDPRVASRMIRDGSEVAEVDVRDYWVRRKG